MTVPDLAWLVHETDNLPLRYSIRSIAENAEGMFGNLWIVGQMPDWLQSVGHVPAPRASEKFADIRSKVSALCADDRLSDRVVILNDDYFAMEPVTSWSPYHMGPTSKYLAGKPVDRNTWFQALRNTAAWMRGRGHGDILCYEGHVPLLFDRHKLGEVLSEYPVDRSCDYPGFYPVAGAGGEGIQGLNAKVGPDASDFHEKAHLPWLSCNDKSFAEGMVGGYVRGAFREPCKYERA